MKNEMMEPYTLQLKDYHEFSWIVAALNFLVKYDDSNPLGDCYYDKKEAQQMHERIQEEFLEYYWQVCKNKDEEGKEYCAFEDNLVDPDFPESWTVYYYDKEVAKGRAKSWNFSNTNMEANSARVALELNDLLVEEAMQDLDLYGDACQRALNPDEIRKCVSYALKLEKEYLRTKEGQEWINSDNGD